MEETEGASAADTSSNDIHGVYACTTGDRWLPILGRPSATPALGRSVDLRNGALGYVLVDDNRFGWSGAGAVEAWVKVTDDGHGSQRIISTEEYGGQAGWALRLDGSNADRLPAPTGQYGMHPACEEFPTPVPLDPRMEPLCDMPLAAMPRRPMTKERQERMEAYETTIRAIERVRQREEQLADHERFRTLGEIHEAQLQLLPRFTNARVERVAGYPHDTVQLEGNWGHNPVNAGDAYDSLQAEKTRRGL